MIRNFIVLLVGTIAVACSAPASGMPACSLFNGYTLSDMLGQGCAVGDKFFYNFESTSPESLLDAITFSPLNPVANDPGIQFNGLAAPAGQTVSLNVSYTVEVSPTPGNDFEIETPELSLPSIAFSPGGSLSGSAGYCEKGKGDAETCLADGGTLYTALVQAAPPATSFSSNVNLATALSLDVALDLTLEGGSTGGSAGPIEERFAQVATPEPATFLLIGSGLLFVARLRPKRKQD